MNTAQVVIVGVVLLLADLGAVALLGLTLLQARRLDRIQRHWQKSLRRMTRCGLLLPEHLGRTDPPSGRHDPALVALPPV